MTAVRFNAISYSNKLTNAGLDKKIADVQAEELSSVLANDLCTKQDFQILRQDFQILRKDFILLKEEVKGLENRMLIKLGAIMLAGLTILGFILHH